MPAPNQCRPSAFPTHAIHNPQSLPNRQPLFHNGHASLRANIHRVPLRPQRLPTLFPLHGQLHSRIQALSRPYMLPARLFGQPIGSDHSRLPSSTLFAIQRRPGALSQYQCKPHTLPYNPPYPRPSPPSMELPRYSHQPVTSPRAVIPTGVAAFSSAPHYGAPATERRNLLFVRASKRIIKHSRRLSLLALPNLLYLLHLLSVNCPIL
jgi:hypothetical protein